MSARIMLHHAFILVFNNTCVLVTQKYLSINNDTRILIIKEY